MFQQLGGVAGGTINICRFVKLSTAADYTLLQAGANEQAIAVATESAKALPIPGADASIAAVAGDAVQTHPPGKICLLELGGTVVRGAMVESDANGKGVTLAATATTRRFVGGFALESGVSGDRIKFLVCPLVIQNP